MSKQALIFCMLILTAPMLAGCWFIAGAAVGGVGGYEIGQDSVSGTFDASFERSYQASLKVIQSMGKPDAQNNWIKAKIDDYDVAVHVERLTDRITQITVSARKYTLPKPQFAHQILDKIVNKLK